MFEEARRSVYSARTFLIDGVMAGLARVAQETMSTIILACDTRVPEALGNVAISVTIAPFTADDYEPFFADLHRQPIEIERLFRRASQLDGHVLTKLALVARSAGAEANAAIFTYLDQEQLKSNLSIADIRVKNFDELYGAQELVKALERDLLLPLENVKLAAELGLKPKRGVILHGPPGTGKTSIGRALARRMGGKFFTLDDNANPDRSGGRFFRSVEATFALAKLNAPSIVFIDDADILFLDGQGQGLYRYLLTLLDGIIGGSENEVCVVMTAMDVSTLPAALVRSGRIDLWLEVELPNATTRREILEALIAGSVQERVSVTGLDALAALTEGFSPADLERITEDAKRQIAFAYKSGILTSFEEALQLATAEVKRNRSLVEQLPSEQHEVDVV